MLFNDQLVTKIQHCNATILIVIILLLLKNSLVTFQCMVSRDNDKTRTKQTQLTFLDHWMFSWPEFRSNSLMSKFSGEGCHMFPANTLIPSTQSSHFLPKLEISAQTNSSLTTYCLHTSCRICKMIIILTKLKGS